MRRFYDDDGHDDDADDTESGDDDDGDSSVAFNDIEKTRDVQCDLSDDEYEIDRSPNATELSIMLFFLWRKHCISKAAANDICRIINYFNIPNMPKDFRRVMSHVKRNNPTLLYGDHSFICPSCSNRCSNASKCDSNKCKSASAYDGTPTSVFTFPLAPQICSILERENIISSTYVSDQCDDMLNSRRHREIVMKEKQVHPERNLVTLTLNNDGVLIKRVSRSLWITCACINELPRRKRFEINNMLICSISTGDEKPKKKEYLMILQDIVNELKLLEDIGFDVILPSKESDREKTYTHFHAFTIAAVCDKPAQSLMMNIKGTIQIGRTIRNRFFIVSYRRPILNFFSKLFFR